MDFNVIKYTTKVNVFKNYKKKKNGQSNKLETPTLLFKKECG